MKNMCHQPFDLFRCLVCKTVAGHFFTGEMQFPKYSGNIGKTVGNTELDRHLR